MKESPEEIHRKIWEWALILEIVHNEGLMKEGSCGMGFAVGQEPLPSIFAKYGCDVVATDINPETANGDVQNMWVETDQHARSLKDLNKRGICDPGVFSQKCKFSFADMNDISPEFYGKFDFVWSSCALEHLGSIKAGKRFIIEAMKCLKPGGIAVHTTEYNVSSNIFTVDSYVKREDAVIFRKKDFRKVCKTLTEQGHHVVLDFTLGNSEADFFVNTLPPTEGPFLKFKARCDMKGLNRIMKYWPFVQTSYGIIMKKSSTTE